MKLLIISLITMLSLESCKKKMIILNEKYQGFQNVISIAECNGPKGPYKTEIHSDLNGYTFFRQDFRGERESYLALVENQNLGYSTNSEFETVDTLSNEVIVMLKSHEFHKMQVKPELFFRNLKFQKDTIYLNKEVEKYLANDMLANSVQLFYDRHAELILGIKMWNPFNLKEEIEIQYKAWQEQDIGKVAKVVEIIQGGKDIYRFNFSEVKINSANFEKKKLKH